jgi:KTSC domain
MQRIRLDSTVLQSVGYQDQLVLLELEFRDGTIYHYFKVSEQIFQELLRAESRGAYFNANIRHRFAYAQIQRAEPTHSFADFTSHTGRR